MTENLNGVMSGEGYPYRAWLAGMERFVMRARVDSRAQAD